MAPAAKANGIDLIFIVSPVTKKDRLNKILAHANGFLYLVSRLGVTGTTERSNSKDLALANLIKEVKIMTKLPICAGFGISSPSDAQSMFAIGADGAISGSQVIKILQKNDFTEATIQLEKFYSEMLVTAAKPYSLSESAH